MYFNFNSLAHDSDASAIPTPSSYSTKEMPWIDHESSFTDLGFPLTILSTPFKASFVKEKSPLYIYALMGDEEICLGIVPVQDNDTLQDVRIYIHEHLLPPGRGFKFVEKRSTIKRNIITPRSEGGYPADKYKCSHPSKLGVKVDRQYIVLEEAPVATRKSPGCSDARKRK